MLEIILISEITFYYFFLIALMIYMFKVRSKAVKDGRVSFKNFKSYTTESPEDLVILQNHFNNQFQIPLFFTMAALLSLTQNTVSTITIVFSTIFILSRFYHTRIHLGSNKLLHRAYSFFAGVIIVGAIFLEVIVRTYLNLN
jgi:hypothetical protein